MNKADKSQSHPYMMTLSLSVLDDLGVNLYSSIPAVLSEVVANAWDADAHSVRIDIDPDGDVITIVDDGCGMDRADVNKKYLTVGYKRRKHESVVTPEGRHVMGRKGIGKLSLFSIADQIELHSVKTNAAKHPRNALLLKTEDVVKAAENDRPYYPTALPDDRIKIKRGTEITLERLRRSPTAATLGALQHHR